MRYTVTTIPNGKWKQNCYAVSADATRAALLIDPGSDAPLIEHVLAKHGLMPVAIVNTHAHYDHVGAVDRLMSKYKIPFYLHCADQKLLKQANLYKLLFDSRDSIVIPQPTHELTTLEPRIQLSEFEVNILFTPGHTQGSCCLLIDGDLFSGDTLLSNGQGRTDLPGGNKTSMLNSVELLRELPPTTTVWPGHGRSFALGSVWEKLDSTGATI